MDDAGELSAAAAAALMAPLSSQLLAGTVQQKKKRKKKNRHKDPNAPRQPMNSYNIFVKEHRQQVVASQQFKDNPEIMREMSRIWRELAPEQRKVFDDMADKDRLRFEEEMKQYSPPKMEMPGGEGDGSGGAAELAGEAGALGQKKRRVASTRSARRKRQRQRDPGVPKFPLNPYNIFVKDVRATVAKSSQYEDNPEVMKEISRRWRALSTEDKQHYRDLSEKDKERYEAEQLQYYKNKAEQQSSAEAAVDIANAIFPGGMPPGAASANAIQNAILSAAASAMAAAMQSQRGDGTGEDALGVDHAATSASAQVQGLAALQALIEQQLNSVAAKATVSVDDTEPESLEAVVTAGGVDGHHVDDIAAGRKDDGAVSKETMV